MVELTHGGANCRIISLNVSKPVTCSLSLTRKLKLLLVSVVCSIICLSVAFSLLATGKSILGMKLFFSRRLPAVSKAPWSCSMLGLVIALSVSMWMNSLTVKTLSLHINNHLCHIGYINIEREDMSWTYSLLLKRSLFLTRI